CGSSPSAVWLVKLKRSLRLRGSPWIKLRSAWTCFIAPPTTRGRPEAAPCRYCGLRPGRGRRGRRRRRRVDAVEVAAHERLRPVHGQGQALLHQDLDHVLDEVAIVLGGNGDGQV